MDGSLFIDPLRRFLSGNSSLIILCPAGKKVVLLEEIKMSLFERHHDYIIIICSISRIVIIVEDWHVTFTFKAFEQDKLAYCSTI